MKAKFVNESLEDVLKPKDKSEFDCDPELAEIYQAYEELRDLGINVQINSNYINPKIRELFISELGAKYQISFLPLKEKDWTGFDEKGTTGWAIYDDDAECLIEGDTWENTKKMILDLIKKEKTI